jgi:uncharacterized lipoprotein YmbA
MKKILCLLVLLFFVVGCANQSAYTAYANAVTSANAYKKAPGITQEFNGQGVLVKQTIVMPDDGVKVAQIKDSEWANPISQFLNLGILGGTSWLVLREAGNIAKAARSTTYDSHDVAGGNIGGNNAGENMAGGDISTSSTPTTTTTTTTGAE